MTGRLVLIFCALLAAAAPVHAAADSTAVDSTAVTPTRKLTAPALPAAAKSAVPAETRRVAPAKRYASPLDSVTARRYGVPHSFTLDDFLTFYPGVFASRTGPLGRNASFSRYGFGEGRAAVRIDGVPVNDPQTGVAPIAHLPVSSVGTLVFDASMHPEGGLDWRLPAPPQGRPLTVLELSKGTNNLKQRRVRFSSISDTVGVDLSYDELLDNGYPYDATGALTRAAGADTRNLGLRLRGKFGDRAAYSFSWRDFESNANGDLISTLRDSRYDGHLAAASVSFGEVRLGLYGRGYKTATPDSSADNQTTGVTAALPLLRAAGLHADVRVVAEDIDATQHLSGVSSRRRVSRATGTLALRLSLESAGVLDADVSLGGHPRYGNTWGVGAGVSRAFENISTGVTVRRSFRLPTMAEMFLPQHTVSGRTLEGNDDVEPERHLEGAVHIDGSVGPLGAAVSVGATRSENTIAFMPGSDGVWRPGNAGGETVTFVDGRLTFDTRWRGFVIEAEGGATLVDGDRFGFFRATPERRVTGSARVGRSLFEATSALYLGADIVSCSARRDPAGNPHDAFNVLNVRIDGRLLDARLFLAWMNILDEQWTTFDNYLMTPRTFIYGVAWDLFQ